MQKNTTNISDKLSNPDPITKETKKRFKSKQPWHNDFENKDISADGGFFFEGSNTEFNRALFIIDSLVKKLKSRGYRFKFQGYNSYVIIHELEIELRFREKKRRVKYERSKGWYDYKLEPTGYLSLKVHHRLSTREWSGTARTPLEQKVEFLVNKLEEFAKNEKDYRDHLEIIWAERARKEEIEKKIKAKRDQELIRFKELLNLSERWNKTKQLQKFLQAMEDEAVIKRKVTPELNEFLTWAVKKIDWYDPLIEREDEVFEKVNRDTLELKSRWG